MMVETRDNKHSIKDWMDCGIISSVAWTSLENRFKIRPIGVDSKKRKFPLRSESKSLLCIVLVALINITTKQIAAIQEIMA